MTTRSLLLLLAMMPAGVLAAVVQTWWNRRALIREQRRAELHREALGYWDERFLELAARAPLEGDTAGYGPAHVLRRSGNVYLKVDGRSIPASDRTYPRPLIEVRPSFICQYCAQITERPHTHYSGPTYHDAL